MGAWLRLTGYIVLIFLALILGGFLSVSYYATLSLFGGIAIALLIINLVLRFLKLERRNQLVIVLYFLIYIFVCIFGFFPRQLMPGFYCSLGQTNMETTLTEYHVVIEPIDFSHGIFRVSERAIYSVEQQKCNSDLSISKSIVEKLPEVSLPEYQIQSSSRGLLIRELRITALKDSPISGTTCCPEITSIELRDFPRDSFYEARYVEKPTSSYYLDTETVKWDNINIRDGIVFAYIAPPFYLLRNIISPFVGLSYQSHWVIAFIGLIVTTVITPIVKPVLSDVVKRRFSSLFDKTIPKGNGKKTTLIVSSTGEEKEIDVKEKPK